MPQQRKTEYLLIALIALIILAYLALYSFIDFGYFPRVSTSDMYEDTLAARLMWEQKSLFPKSYLFGNQFYVVATPVLSAPAVSPAGFPELQATAAQRTAAAAMNRMVFIRL